MATRPKDSTPRAIGRAIWLKLARPTGGANGELQNHMQNKADCEDKKNCLNVVNRYSVSEHYASYGGPAGAVRSAPNAVVFPKAAPACRPWTQSRNCARGESNTLACL